MSNSGLQRLYDLLDSLEALRLEFANGMEGQKALAALGRARILAVRTVLDTAIYGIKLIIGDVQRPRQPKVKDARASTTERGDERSH